MSHIYKLKCTLFSIKNNFYFLIYSRHPPKIGLYQYQVPYITSVSMFYRLFNLTPSSSIWTERVDYSTIFKKRFS